VSKALAPVFLLQMRWLRVWPTFNAPPCSCKSFFLKSRRRRAVRLILGVREIRNRNLGGALFSDPAWSILLDAYASDLDGRRISVSDVCIASGVPSTTALRWLKALEDQGLMKRENDARDRRRAFVTLTPKSQTVLERLIDEVIQKTGNMPIG
jgi:DNA-binding MarR family transcriptional regulator